MAAPRFSTGKLSSRTACAMGCMPPPPAPCSTRARINIGMLTDAPQSSEDDGEHRDGKHQQPFAAEHGGQPAAGRKHDGVGDQVAGEDPGGFVDGGGEVAGDVRQGDVGHRGIQHHHEGGQHDRDRHDPRIDAGHPVAVRVFEKISRHRPTPERQMIPATRKTQARTGRSACAGGCRIQEEPQSETIVARKGWNPQPGGRVEPRRPCFSSKSAMSS